MDTAAQLFRRCVQCPSTTPSCPACASDETCTLIATSCDACASTVCTKISESSTSHHSTPAGAIAGGVIGGVAAIALLVFLVWRFLIRDRRKEWESQAWSEEIVDAVEKSQQPGVRRAVTTRSVRSMHSIASTVLTRASNVIQIAYIPGVTNRSPPDTPGVLVPPVPPLPLATVKNHSTASTPNFEQDQHFFLPGDIRDSTWSGYTDMTRASISPSLARSSVATTIYRDNAIVSPLPAQQALRGKAAVVSVKSGSSTPTSDGAHPGDAPPMPANATAIAAGNSSIVGRSVQARPIQVRRVSPATNVPTLRNLQVKANNGKDFRQSRLDSPSEASSEDDETIKPSQHQSTASDRTARQSNAITVIDESPTEDASSTALPHMRLMRNSQGGPSHRHRKSGSGTLQSLIEDAMNRASKTPPQVGLGSISEAASSKSSKGQSDSPFSDANEVKENS